jgi:hypothetical protein
VGSVHERVDPALGQSPDDSRYGHDHAGQAGYVVDDRDACPVGGAVQQELHDFVRRSDREWNVDRDDARTRPARNEVHRIPAGVVLVVCREELVSRLEAERAEDRVDAGRCIRDEDEVIGVHSHEGRGLGTRRGCQIIELSQ